MVFVRKNLVDFVRKNLVDFVRTKAIFTFRTSVTDVGSTYCAQLQLYFTTYHGCQMLYLQTKNINFGKFWKALECKLSAYFMTFRYFYVHSVYFRANWYILWLFGIFFQSFDMSYREKSGNPATYLCRKPISGR
jgi:hypothetical protein